MTKWGKPFDPLEKDDISAERGFHFLQACLSRFLGKFNNTLPPSTTFTSARTRWRGMSGVSRHASTRVCLRVPHALEDARPDASQSRQGDEPPFPNRDADALVFCHPRASKSPAGTPLAVQSGL